jgi:hypothetical protein
MGLLVRAWIVAAAAASLGIGRSQPQTQDASAAELVAVYLVNFVRFTRWPSDVLPDGSTIVVCVGGDGRVADSLARAIRNRPINGHPLAIRKTTLDHSFEGCHVLYAPDLDGTSAERLIQTTSMQPILTVSDAADFAEIGGVANFFVDNGRMKFAVNPNAAVRARLRISSRLLTLARIVGS